ncbi:MAG: hypothetical protein WKH64_01015 [Chloroflexia bacterium]
MRTSRGSERGGARRAARRYGQRAGEDSAASKPSVGTAQTSDQGQSSTNGDETRTDQKGDAVVGAQRAATTATRLFRYLRTTRMITRLAGAGVIDVGPEPAPHGPTTVGPDTVVSATVSPDDVSSEPPGPPPAKPAAKLINTARYALADKLNLSDSDITLVKSEQATWDASLGCGLPGRPYAELAQYGYQLTIAANDVEYVVHSNQNGGLMILCQDGKPTLLVGEALP